MKYSAYNTNALKKTLLLKPLDLWIIREMINGSQNFFPGNYQVYFYVEEEG